MNWIDFPFSLTWEVLRTIFDPLGFHASERIRSSTEQQNQCSAVTIQWGFLSLIYGRVFNVVFSYIFMLSEKGLSRIQKSPRFLWALHGNVRSEPRRELALPAFLPPACHYVAPRVLFLQRKTDDVIHLCHTLNYFLLLRRKIIQRPQEDTFSPTLPSKSLPRLLPVLGHQSLPGPVPAVILLKTLLPFAACQLLIL